MTFEQRRIAAFISGGGSTIEKIITATADNRLPRSKVVVIVTSNAEAVPEDRRRFFQNEGIPVTLVLPKEYTSSQRYGQALLGALRPYSPDLIGQYGHTPLTPENVIVNFEGRMINQHPGPVDPSEYDFGGKGMSSALRVHAARLEFVKRTHRNLWTDVTAQRVGVGFDAGRVIKRKRVVINFDDTVYTLNSRALLIEWETQIETLRDFEEDRVVELPPYDDLVRDEERESLRKAKVHAQRLFP